MKFKEATLKDIPQLVELWVLLRKFYGKYNPPWKKYVLNQKTKVITYREIKTSIKNPKEKFFVAVNKSYKIIGMLKVSIEKTSYCESPKYCGEISHVYVKPRCRRKGITIQLIKKAVGFFLKHKKLI